ncbi:unnamed protein product [Mytilus edulis]|uniref:Uncharacterized protein n=1 Tax=Mytilus edulis TaxID=6550 RepID=A0A8S3QUJ1_MYTED|nr:unnamed protein product [Mytilus edulis]
MMHISVAPGERNTVILPMAYTSILKLSRILIASCKNNKITGPSVEGFSICLSLIKAVKIKHKELVDRGQQNDISITSEIKALRELRKQMRKAKYEDRQKICSEVMDNPSMKKFYQLININRGQSKTSTTSIIKGPDWDISDLKNQAKRFFTMYGRLICTKR